MIKFGRTFWWVVGLILVAFVLTRLPELSDNLIYARLLILLLIVVVASFLWSLLSIIGVELARSKRTTRMQVGEIFVEIFELANRSFIPKVWIKVTDQSQLPGAAGSRVLTNVGVKQSRTFIAYSLLQNRGWFTLGPTKIESGDLFGLFVFRKRFISSKRLLVIPYTVNIQDFPAPFGILPGGRALRQKTLEVTPYAAGVREYVSGDPLKRIHWPTSARTQKLIVKEFEKDPLAEVWIFLDARKAVHTERLSEADQAVNEFWWVKGKREFKLPPSTEEYAVSTAATIARYYINQKREVGLVAAGQKYTILPAERGERQLGKILETLAVLEAEGDMPLWGLINSQLNHLARGSTIILISPASDDQMMTVVMELVQRGLMPVVILLDRSSFGGEEDTSRLEGMLANHGILTFIIREGDDLRFVLENPKSLLDARLIFHKV